MTDARALARAYLEQQRLLGTDQVVLPADSRAVPLDTPALRPGLGAAVPEIGALTPGVSPGKSEGPGVSPGKSDGPGVSPGKSEGPGVSPGKSEAPNAADPLPPPGVSYDPPVGDLFTKDPLREAETLAGIAELVAECRKCRLCEARQHTVPGEGPGDARLVVVGEGPGRTEDETGRPFVGQAGDLLTKILAAIDLPRERVYICNIVKCRPPENRTPQFDEIASCLPYLHRQIELVAPKVILAMGSTAAQALLNTKSSLGGMRNLIHRFRGTPVVVTYHPAALLRNPNWKKPTWDDVRIARRLLDA